MKIICKDNIPQEVFEHLYVTLEEYIQQEIPPQEIIDILMQMVASNRYYLEKEGYKSCGKECKYPG